MFFINWPRIDKYGEISQADLKTTQFIATVKQNVVVM